MTHAEVAGVLLLSLLATLCWLYGKGSEVRRLPESEAEAGPETPADMPIPITVSGTDGKWFGTVYVTRAEFEHYAFEHRRATQERADA